MARVRGSVGTSLRSDGAVAKMGRKATKTGELGERKLDKALERSPRTSEYARWRSLSIPRSLSGKKYQSDVDFALANGDTIVLVDAKNWGGGFLWSMSGYVMDGFRRKRSYGNEPHRVGRNMAMAVDIYQRHCDRLYDNAVKRGQRARRVKVVGIVVFVPTARGSLPTSVRFLRFPGTKGSYLLEAGLKAVSRILGKPQYTRKGRQYVNPISLSLLDSNTR